MLGLTRAGSVAISTAQERNLFVCYISGLDLRRIVPDATPFLASLFDTYPWVRITNLPSNELLPTILTGVYPDQHGVWGVRLKSNASVSSTARFVDRLPDAVTTTVQCVLHLVSSTYDLAAIPPRRRRRFEITRTKYKRRKTPAQVLPRIGTMPSMIGVVGQERSRYLFSTTPDPEGLLPRLCSGRHALEVLELYSLDRFQQWNLDRVDETRRFYGLIDRFLKRLHEKCAAAGMTLAIVSDHGHEVTRDSIDLVAKLKQSDVDETEYSYFLEVNMVRFWFHTENARHKIGAILSSLEHGRLLTFADMAKYHVPLDDARYGEVFFILESGYMFFPHDFYHPIANVFFAVTDRMQRSRLSDPRHRANHGYLPDSETEQAFAILLDRSQRATVREGELIDLAPSLLKFMGRTPPESMKGRRLFSD